MFGFLSPPIALNRWVMTSPPAALHASVFNHPSPSLQGVHMQPAPSPDPSGLLAFWLNSRISAVVRYPYTYFTLCFQSRLSAALINWLKVDKCTEILSTRLFYLLGRICSSISQAMGKTDLDLCFIFLPLVCCLCSIKLLQSLAFRPNSVRATLRNLCTRMVKSCQQIEKLHPHLQGTKPHFWMLAAI